MKCKMETNHANGCFNDDYDKNSVNYDIIRYGIEI